MTILSLFDGMSGGQLALKNIGITPTLYLSSEIDHYAMSVARYNFPNTAFIGSVTEIDINALPHIDLLIGGSPCQGFSFSGKRLGATTKEGVEITTLKQYLKLKKEAFEFEGQSFLFWEYIRILKGLQKKNPDLKFFLENVKMENKWKSIFNNTVGVNAVEINSSLVSAQNRVRYYWHNWDTPNIPDLGITLTSIMVPNTAEVNTVSSFKECVRKNILQHHKLVIESTKMLQTVPCTSGFQDNKVGILKAPTLRAGNSFTLGKDINNNIRLLTVNEWEALQTVPKDYTKLGLSVYFKEQKISNTQRFKMLGNGWTIQIVSLFFNSFFQQTKKK